MPGCDRGPQWCDVHHVDPAGQGGITADVNGMLACRRHHTTLHKPGWHAKLLPDNTLTVTYPNGTTRTSRPPGQHPKLW